MRNAKTSEEGHVMYSEAPAGRAGLIHADTTSRRSTLAVPGSNQRMLDKARSLATDAVFLDLEDSVSPVAKDLARDQVVTALVTGGYRQHSISVRVNARATSWCLPDLEAIVSQAPGTFDCIIMPKVQSVDDIIWMAAQLSRLEMTANLPQGGIGIEVQIEDALGLINVESIAASHERIKTLVFGPADFMASVNMKTLVVGAQPAGYTEGDAYHYPLMRMLVAGRAFGKQVIDGPYLGIKDVVGLKQASMRSAALGFDGKWVLHPDQIDVVNEIFSPSQDDFDKACTILDAYDLATSHTGGARGAVMLDEEMIDEASRKMALVVWAKGTAAGLQRMAEVNKA